MSFDIHLQCFENNGSPNFPRRIVWDKIAPYSKFDIPMARWKVIFPDMSGGLVSVDADDQIDGFSVNRPVGGMFYDVLVEIMREAPILLYWGEGCCVADKSTIATLPGYMIDALGIPPVVQSGKELMDCIYSYKSPPPVVRSET